MLQEIVGTLVGRWYVTTFGITFVVLASRHLGWRRTGIYTAVAIVVGVVAEHGSVSFGIPYTRYAFNDALRGNELFVGNVPLMVTLSYTFMSYFAFATARVIASGLWRLRSPIPLLEYVLGVALAVWGIWVVDPISRLGAHFFLGELFRYDGPGFWFGLPLGSQLGFALTSAILVGFLTYLMRDESDGVVEQPLRHPHLPAIGGYLGQVVFMASTAFFVARTSSNPAVIQTADALCGSAFLIFVPMGILTAVHWRTLAVTRHGEPVPPFPARVGADGS